MTPTPPTILQLIPHLDAGGAEMTTLEVTAAIVKGGGRALVLSEGGRLADRIVAAGGEFIPFPASTKNPARIVSNGFNLSKIIAREHVSLIHARSRAPAWSALLAARRSGIPFVTTYHGAYNERSKVKSLYNGVMARADRVIANSRYTADLVRQRYGTPAEKIRTIYRGVDFSRFDVTAVTPERTLALRRAWNIADGQRIVVQVARMTAWKGQRDVVATAARLLPRFADVVFVLAGDAQGRHAYRDEIAALAARHGIGDRVKIVGHVEDVPAAFHLAHMAIVASVEPEAFGRAAAEAQAMRCPVISTNIGAPPETVLAPPRVGAAERTGWLVPPGDIAAYEAALTEGLVMSPQERTAMGDRARRHVMTSFNVTGLQCKTLEVYDELLGSRLAARFTSARSASG